MPAKPRLLITVNHHFDPLWRRCWQRPLHFKGLVYRSYGDLETYAMLDHLDIARSHDEYAFDAESVVVARAFLRRHPEKLEELKQLYDQGRFAVGGSGDNIIDSNMVVGESIVRNFLYGFRWVEETFGHTTPLVTRKDAFGNSAQLPQIVRGFGVKWLWPIYYGPGPEGDYWRGLDGSTLCVAAPPVVQSMDAAPKYKPCPACRGAGCRQCGQRGIEPDRRNALPPEERIEKLHQAGGGVFTSVAEEMLPNPELLGWAKRARKRFDVRFVTTEQLAELVQDKIDRVDDPPEDEIHTYAPREKDRRHNDAEINPNNTGVYVTRIKLKQNLRRQEYALQSAERLAALATLGGGRYPSAGLAEAWELLLFTMFHDCVTGTMVDQAYEELIDYWDRIDRVIDRVRRQALKPIRRDRQRSVDVFNPLGEAVTAPMTVTLATSHRTVRLVDERGRDVPIIDQRKADDGSLTVSAIAHQVPALGTERYRVQRGVAEQVRSARKPVIENARFRVTADEGGVVAIYDKRLKRNISEAGEYRPGELILEKDEGSPWATLDENQRRTRLGRQSMEPGTGCRLLSVEKTASWQRLTFETKHWGKFRDARRFVGRMEVTLYRGLERVDFVTSGFWSCYNERLRVAFPLPIKGKHLYEVPYGVLEREPYRPWFGWQASNGDWPAVNWAGVEGRDVSIALLNKGLPSYKIEKARWGSLLLLTPVRSPTYPTYLHEPDRYIMTDFDGMRDEGDHRFEYALTAYSGRFADSSVVHDAEAYNVELLALSGGVDLPSPPRIDSDVARLTTLKRAEDGRQLILRMAEFRGRGGEAMVTLPEGMKTASVVDLMERNPEPLDVVEGRVRLPFAPWQIRSVRFGR